MNNLIYYFFEKLKKSLAKPQLFHILSLSLIMSRFFYLTGEYIFDKKEISLLQGDNLSENRKIFQNFKNSFLRNY